MASLIGGTAYQHESLKWLLDNLKDTPLGNKIRAVVEEKDKTLEDVRQIDIEPEIKSHSQIGSQVSISFSGQSLYTIYFKDGWKKSFWYQTPVVVEDSK